MATPKPSTTMGFTFVGSSLETLRAELNRFATLVAQHIDQMRGVRGNPTFDAPPDFKGHRAMGLGAPQDFNDAQILGRSLARGDATGPWDAQGNTLTHLADGRARDDAATVGQIQDSIKKNANLTVSTDAPSGIEAGDVSDPGSGTAVSAGNHQHALSTALVGDIKPTADAASAGISTTLPRGDHIHQLLAPVMATGSLPAAGAGNNGRVIVEISGATLNLILYGNNIRARIAGVAF